MPHLAIKIVGKNDKFEFEMLGPYIEGELHAAAILEAGMASGKTSVMFHARVNGRDVVLQTSAEIINALNSAIQGANIRFATNK